MFSSILFLQGIYFFDFYILYMASFIWGWVRELTK